MKILHFTTTVGGGGAETMLCNIVEQMAANGVESVVVSTTSSIGDNSLKERLERCSRFYDLEAGSLLSLRMMARFRKILLAEQPDIVQTWMHTSGVVAGGVSFLTGFRKIVWGVHSKELFIDPSSSSLKAFLLKAALAFGSKFLPRKIISCSQVGITIHQQELSYPEQKMVWVANGIDTDRFRPNEGARAKWRQQLNIPADSLVVGMVTRMAPIKDVPTFLRAITIAQSAGSQSHFVICGEGLDHADTEIRECVDQLPDASRLHWIPFQHQIEDVYPLFDWLTLTSLSEACPMVLIEAMSCGVPCISTDVGDAKLIIDRSGYTFPPQAPKELAEIWKEIESAPRESHQFRSELSRNLTISRFRLEDCVSNYRKIYQDLLPAA